MHKVQVSHLKRLSDVFNFCFVAKTSYWIRTRDLRDTGAMLYQLSYEATHWDRAQFIEFISSREE